MKRSLWVLLIYLVFNACAYSQEKNWRLDIYNFFDNTEFGRSHVKIPQTMAGVNFAPEAGIVWDTANKVNIGISLQHEFGSIKAIDRFYPTAYYESDRGAFHFLMGAFPRIRVLGNYPRLFIQDSITYYRPNMNGLFWQYTWEGSYANVWLDWTGRQTRTENEQFFIGFSGRYKRGIFYLQNFGYLHHYAARLDPVVEEPLRENLLVLTSFGIDLSGKSVFDRLEANAGWVSDLERSRLQNTGWLSSNGLLVETKIEYRRIGLFNTFYSGGGLMHFYNELGNKLYWNDPAYRSKKSDRADIYFKFIERSAIDLKLTYSLTFMENRIYHEQMLKVIVNLNSIRN